MQMDELYIQSRQNEQVKNLVKLRERKHRNRRSRFLIEGLREIEHAIRAGFELPDLYYCPEFFSTGPHAAFIKEQKSGGHYRIVRLSEKAFQKASHRENPDGLIAIGVQQNDRLSDFNPPEQALILILEGIEKPGNLGAILRSADGAGVDAVILVDCAPDLYNPNTIRSSQGLLFALPVLSTDRTTLSAWLEKQAIECCATTPSSQKVHWEADFRRSIALILGSESDGLSHYWLERSSQTIRIPMAGQADSLNVAAATAVCLYEVRRQREMPPPD